MSDSVSSTKPSDTTFRFFSNEQGKNYAQHRYSYHPQVYETVLDYHTSTGGKLDTILDIGCGPGTAIRAFAPHFKQAIGLDPSEGMISTARSLGGATATSEAIRFDISTAEELGMKLSPPVGDGSVDLITAATAAHWFDMPAFWKCAAQVLKPGATVAIWTSGFIRFHQSMPNYTALQLAMSELEEMLKDNMLPGNILSHNLYIALPLPWTIETPVPEFDESSFVRKTWHTGAASDVGDEFFAVGNQGGDLDTLEKILGTTSPVIRWREAHPDAVGTEKDVVRILRRKIENILHENGVEKGKEIVKGGAGGVLLMVKKKNSVIAK